MARRLFAASAGRWGCIRCEDDGRYRSSTSRAGPIGKSPIFRRSDQVCKSFARSRSPETSSVGGPVYVVMIFFCILDYLPRSSPAKCFRNVIVFYPCIDAALPTTLVRGVVRKFEMRSANGPIVDARSARRACSGLPLARESAAACGLGSSAVDPGCPPV